MRLLPRLGLFAGLAMLGWGGYSLYARFAGGPEVYWGKDRVEDLADLEQRLETLRRIYARDELRMLEYRDAVAAMPAGAPQEEAARDLDAKSKVMQNRDKDVKQLELLFGTRRTQRDVATGRVLFRGILFSVLGFVWVFLAGRAVFRKPRRVQPPPRGVP